ncbi:MAG: hypothetical protein ABUK01_16400 [Leptospirales bacterium]
MIFITTNNGVFKYNKKMEKAEELLNPSSSLGFFGLGINPRNGKILAASREKIKIALNSKHGSDVRLYEIDPESGNFELVAELYKLFDVHQIAMHKEFVFLTDTTKNKIHVYDLEKQQIHGILNFGSLRKDVHHVNAVSIIEQKLWVGLNNRGETHSELFTIPVETAIEMAVQKQDLLKVGYIQKLSGIRHSHDVEPCHGKILVCASHDGYVAQLNDLKTNIDDSPGNGELSSGNVDDITKIIQIENSFVRGIVCNKEGLWVGVSARAKRSERHRNDLNGEIRLYSWNNKTLIKTVPIQGAGQINDLISI